MSHQLRVPTGASDDGCTGQPVPWRRAVVGVEPERPLGNPDQLEPPAPEHPQRRTGPHECAERLDEFRYGEPGRVEVGRQAGRRQLAVGQVRLTGVLDFEGALAGDPLFDLAKAMFYLDPLQKEAVLTGYGPLGRPAAQDTLALYHLYFTLELWCWFAQIGEAHRLAALQSDLERMLA